jgi:hypothetical protein
MVRVLIPFTDLEGAERAVQQVLDKPRRPQLEVELLAIVEPLTPGKVGIYLTRGRAESLARAAAERWIDQLGARLRARGIPCRGRVELGRPRRVIDAAVDRDDVDRVLLPAPRRFAGTRRLGGAFPRTLHRPVTLVR